MNDAHRFCSLVRRYGEDAVSFQGLHPMMRVWFDPESRDSAVAYFDTGHAWVGAGGPVCPTYARALVAERFVAAARQVKRRASFFGVEDPSTLAAWPSVNLGEEPSLTPEAWRGTARSVRSLREQLRRAAKKGIVAAPVPAENVREASAGRREVETLLKRWIASRRIEPMGFLIAPELFTLPEEHRYIAARNGNDLVGFLSAIPAYAGDGWLIEHLLCAPGAPNGTAETLIDALLAAIAAAGEETARVSLGLAPLSGGGWHPIVRAVARPLFDFEGLHRFKARLRPAEWCSVWLVTSPGSSRLIALIDALAAFAGGGIVRFALRSLFLHPRGLLTVLALGLVPWTSLLLWLDATHAQGAAGYSRAALAVWIAFDALLATGLFRAALRPATTTLFALFVAALTDAVLSSFHLSAVGLGPTRPDAVLRLLAVIAPWGGALMLFITAIQRGREASATGSTSSP